MSDDDSIGDESRQVDYPDRRDVKHYARRDLYEDDSIEVDDGEGFVRSTLRVMKTSKPPPKPAAKSGVKLAASSASTAVSSVSPRRPKPRTSVGPDQYSLSASAIKRTTTGPAPLSKRQNN